MIYANEYIKTGFSIEDANKLQEAINKNLLDEKITIDFSGIKIFTTLFFNNALTKYVINLGPEKYKEKFEIINLSEIGNMTYEHSLENAMNYYNLSEDGRKIQDSIVSDVDDVEDWLCP